MTASGIEQAVASFVRREFEETFRGAPVEEQADAHWQKITALGTQLWLDTGDIEEATALWNAEFSALTTNNTLLNKEIQKGIYDDLIARASGVLREAEPTLEERTLVLEVAFILNAMHGLRLVDTFDARVSVELHTDLSHDMASSVDYGRRYFAICPKRFIVKVPLTPAGFLAARILRGDGIPLNFTLGFSARHNYVAALLTHPTYVNVFMGRLNAFVVDHGLGDGLNVGEKATLATQRELLALRDAGRTDTRLIGASIRNGDQIVDLAGVDVFTMPPKAAAEYRKDPPDGIASQVENDPSIALAEGIQLSDFNGATLWDVPHSFKTCVDGLIARDIPGLTPADVTAHFHNAGFSDFLPSWTQEELDIITADGKIPSHPRWEDRLASGEIGLDALMNASALQSFATDQAELDDRIRTVLQAAGMA